MNGIPDFPVQHKRPRRCSACSIGVPPPPQMEEPQTAYRFHPRDDEVIVDYLVPRMRGRNQQPTDPIRFVELYDHTPERIQETLGVHHEDEIWVYTVLPRTGAKRVIRDAHDYFWKKNSDTKEVTRDGEVVGCTVSYKFMENKTTSGWIMKEYFLRADDPARHEYLKSAVELVVCCIQNKKLDEQEVAEALLNMNE